MWVSPHLLKLLIYFVGSGSQLSWVFDLRTLYYLEHCSCLKRNKISLLEQVTYKYHVCGKKVEFSFAFFSTFSQNSMHFQEVGGLNTFQVFLRDLEKIFNFHEFSRNSRSNVNLVFNFFFLPQINRL